MSNLKTLKEIWEENGSKGPIEVNYHSEPCTILGTLPDGAFYGYYNASKQSGLWGGIYKDWHPYIPPKPRNIFHEVIYKHPDGALLTFNSLQTETTIKTDKTLFKTGRAFEILDSGEVVPYVEVK